MPYSLKLSSFISFSFFQHTIESMAPEYYLMLEWRDYMIWTFTILLFIISLYYIGRMPSKSKERVETEEERDEEISSSSSAASNSQHPRWDVFLSFRGEDTRKTFTGHLYKALSNRGIHTFMDDTGLKHGAPISKELLKAIEQSQVALIIFSVNYASSTWCLDELVKIMECKKTNQSGESSVIPIFYDVDPSIVRHQRETFAEALKKHESRFKAQKVQRWRTALTAAANLTGYDIRQGIEANWIEQIVNQISSRFRKTSLSYLQNIVGKTTITKAIFDTLSDQYKAASFLANVKENKGGPHVLQNIFLPVRLGEKDNCVNNKEVGKDLTLTCLTKAERCLTVSNQHQYNTIRHSRRCFSKQQTPMSERLRFKKVLIVLDDINHINRLDYLAGGLDWFGSRIIVTTRERHLIGRNDVYEVTPLVKDEALQLFIQPAFKKKNPDESFKDLTMEVVSNAKGLPLALKVWGRNLHNRDINQLRSAIAEMKKYSNLEIFNMLKISCNLLEPKQTYFACFYRGKKRGEIKPISKL